MKKFSSFYKNHRGFTLVELMIVIAIIGILAAVLYPSLTGYLEKTRDTNRTKALANIQLALGTYQVEEGAYPKIGTSNPTGTDGCAADLKTALVSHITSIPTDPKKNFGAKASSSIDCAQAGKWWFAYRLISHDWSTAADASAYALAARMENKSKANITSTVFMASNPTSTTLNTDIANTNKTYNATTLPYYAIIN